MKRFDIIRAVSAILLFVLFRFSSGAQERIDVGAEIWIEPGQTQTQIDDWFRLACENRMFSVRLFMMWNFIETSPGTFDFTLYDYAFDAADKYGIEIEATLCAIHAPVFYSDRFRGRPQFNELFPSEEIMDAASGYIRETVTRYRDRKSLGSWWVLNEPRRFDPESPLAQRQLQRWAENRYGSIDAVNENWITAYKSFDDIKYDSLWENGSYFSWPVPSIDWRLFQRDFLTYNLNWIAEEIRKHDNSHVVTMNPANVFESAYQYDLPAYRDIFDVYGASMHASWQLRFLPRDCYAYAVAGISEILRGSAPDGKFWVSELQGGNNIWSGKDAMCPDSLDLAQWVWTGIGSGARKVIYWSLNYRRQGIEAGEWGLFGFGGEPTDRSRVTEKINRTLQEYGDVFKSARPVSSNVTLLLSPETMRVLLHIDPFGCGAEKFDKDAHVHSLLAWFIALQQYGCQADIKYLEDYGWESSEAGRTVIMADMVAVPDSMVQPVKKFVAEGNTLIMEGLTSFFNEYEVNVIQDGFPFCDVVGGKLEDLRMRDTLNMTSLYRSRMVWPSYMWLPVVRAETAEVVGYHEEGSCALRNNYGKGLSLWFPSCLSMGTSYDDLSPLSEIIARELTETIHSQPFYFKNESPGLLMRILETENEYVTVIVNNRNVPAKTTLVPYGAENAEVIFSLNSSFRNFKVNFAPRGTIVIKWKKS